MTVYYDTLRDEWRVRRGHVDVPVVVRVDGELRKLNYLATPERVAGYVMLLHPDVRLDDAGWWTMLIHRERGRARLSV